MDLLSSANTNSSPSALGHHSVKNALASSLLGPYLLDGLVTYASSLQISTPSILVVVRIDLSGMPTIADQIQLLSRRQRSGLLIWQLLRN